MRAGPTALRRFVHMTVGWGTVGAAHAFGARYGSAPAQVPGVGLDQAMSYHPYALYFYLSFFILAPLTYAVVPPVRLVWLTTGMQVCACVAAATFIAWPTTVGPPTEAAGVGLRWLAAMDSTNCLPSLHGALSVLCAWALLQGHRPLRSGVMIAWAVLICWSTLSLKRHLAVDLFAGVALGMVCGAIVLPARRWRRAW